MTPLLEELQALEVELHHPGIALSRERLERLLHPGFHEVGRSGRAYSRATVIQHLAAQSAPPLVASDGFAVALLEPAVALLTYRSAHEQPDGRQEQHTLRSSIWQKTALGWQLRYHQGTPAAQAW
ncbi:DUF4440 domain-containing protein [Paracidovorax wautersii]|uniref:nuclear transport factor 2 family protein n=1 Tax=Paracidovorax wautersii TaxID=1177982 RepID=UPI0031CE59B0